MIILLAILTTAVLITGIMRILVKDFGKFVIRKTFSLNMPKSFVDIGEYFSMWLFTIAIGVVGFFFYKFAAVLISYILTGDLIEFFIILRSVFTIASDSQSPFTFQHIIAGFILSPALQFFTCFVIYKAIRSFMLFINVRYKPEVYNESDLLYFSFVAVLAFMSFEIVSFSQNIPAVSAIAHFIYLGIAKLACVPYFLTIAHNHLLDSSEYKNSLPQYFNLKRLERKVLFTPRLNILVTYIIGAALNVPFVLGTQFLQSNLMVIFICALSCLAFYSILKAFLSKAYNYVGAILFYHKANVESMLIASKPLFHNHKKQIAIALGILLISLAAYKPKIFAFLTLMTLFMAAFILLAYIIGYLLSLGLSVYRAKRYGAAVPALALPAANYVRNICVAFCKAVLPVFLFMILITALLAVAPKKYHYRHDDTYVTSVLDNEGYPLYTKFNDGNSAIPVCYNELPEFLVKCLLIQEDRSFMAQNSWMPNLSNWHGFSVASIYRMIFGTGGGSNLNQQLIKNEAFKKGFPVDIQRKFSETITAFQLSLQLAPNEIACQYFNKAAWNGGNTHSGIAMGSLFTFGLPVQELNELEMLYLVVTLKRGNNFKMADSIINYKDAAIFRNDIKKTLLNLADSWHKENLLTRKDLNKLRNGELRFTNAKYESLCKASTRDFFNKQIGSKETSCKTYRSSISIANERAIQGAVNEFNSQMGQHLKSGNYDLYSAAVVINVRNGKVLGHYGSSNIVDLTTMGTGRNMGSVIKPFLYLELLENGFAANNVRLYDGPVNGQRTPQNYSHRYSYKYVGIDEALYRSLNAPAVNTRLLTEPIQLFRNIEDRFKRMGIHSDPYLQLDNETARTVNILNYPIGSRNMTLMGIAQAYQALFNRGMYIKLSAFDSYFDPYMDSTVIMPDVSGQIYSPENAERIKLALHGTMMKGGTAYHLNKILKTETTMYAKTGTTDKGRDGYCILSDGEILVIAYVSYGEIRNNQLRLGLAQIPFGAGGRSAGVLSAVLYNHFSSLN